MDSPPRGPMSSRGASSRSSTRVRSSPSRKSASGGLILPSSPTRILPCLTSLLTAWRLGPRCLAYSACVSICASGRCRGEPAGPRDFIEAGAAFEPGGDAGERLQAPRDDVDIGRIELEADADAV